MNETTPNQGQHHPPKGNQPERVGPEGPDRDTADDQGINTPPDDREPSIPELDEPDSAPGEGQDPKRNNTR
jgi:hypothetical protein